MKKYILIGVFLSLFVSTILYLFYENGNQIQIVDLIERLEDEIEEEDFPEEEENELTKLEVKQLKKARQELLDIRNQRTNTFNSILKDEFEVPKSNEAAGKVDEIVIDRNDINRMFVASNYGGLWFSEDKGQNWNPLDPILTDNGMVTVAQDFQNQNVFYAGGRSGLWKWNFGSNDLQEIAGFDRVARIEASPTEPGIIYVIGDDGNSNTNSALFKVNLNSSPAAISTVFNESSYLDDIAFTSTGKLFFTSKLHLYKYNGSSYSSICDFITPYANKNFMAIHEGATKTTVYTANMGNEFLYIAKYVENLNGSNPSCNFINAPDFYKKTTSIKPSSFQWQSHSKAIAVNPDDVNMLFIGSRDAYVSHDGGSTFYLKDYGHSDYNDYDFIDGELFICNDGGVFSTIDFGQDHEVSLNWLNQGLNALEFNHCDYLPNGNNCTGGVHHNGGWLNSDNTELNESLSFGDGMFAQADDIDLDRFFNTAQNGIVRKISVSTGATESFPSASSNFITQIYLNPCVPDVLFKKVEENNNLLFSKISVISPLKNNVWEHVTSSFESNKLAMTNGDFYCNPIYFSTEFEGIYRIDNLSTQSPGDEKLISTNDDFEGVIYINSDPNDPNVAYILTEENPPQIFKSENANTTNPNNVTWQELAYDGIPSGLKYQCIAASPEDSDHLLLGTNMGLFSSVDGGYNWFLEDGIPLVEIKEIRIRPDDNKAFFATFGRGIWTSNLKSCSNQALVLGGNLTVETYDYITTNTIQTSQNITAGLSAVYNSGTSVTFKDGFHGKGSGSESVCGIIKGCYTGQTNKTAQNEKPDIKSSSLDIKVFPNPFDAFTNFEFLLEDKAKVSLDLFDQKGRLVKKLMEDEERESGKHSIKISGLDLAPGIYFAKFRTPDRFVSKKLIISR